MTQLPGNTCAVCGLRDQRALVQVTLAGGARVVLCGSHAVMQSRARPPARSASELREQLRDRRDRSDRRTEGDELGEALVQAFRGERREGHRRREPAP